MSDQAPTNLTEHDPAYFLAGISLRSWLITACLATHLVAAASAEAQAWDSAPTRDRILAAISASVHPQSCCGNSGIGFSEQQQSPSADSAAVLEPDWDGLKRDTWYFIGAQVASLGVIYVLPESVSGWSQEQKDDFGFSKWEENISNPQIDKDDFVINYVLHPYWGAAYYVRARERGYGKLNSFWYSTFLSTLYEAGPEALFEQPSIQDLIVTPVFGAWLGEYFMGLRSDIRDRAGQRGFRSGRENWLWYLTDPLDLVNIGVNRLFGQTAEVSFAPVIGFAGTYNGLKTAWSSRFNASAGLVNYPLLTRQGNPDSQRFAGFRFRISW